MKHYFLPLLLALCLMACKEKINYVLKVELKQLDPADIYSIKKVEEVIFDATERNPDSLVEQSRKEFLKGADYLKNQHKPFLAATYFKRSILAFPQAKAYYELGDALYQSGGKENLKESLKAYSIAEDLDFSPAHRLYFYKARVNAALFALDPNWGDYGVYHNLRLAFTNGYSDTVEIQSLSPFQKVVQNDRYHYLVQNYMGSRPDGTDLIFNAFVMQFGPALGEFSLDTTQLRIPENSASISYDFRKYVPEMQNMSFGREVSHDFFYVARVSENPNYVAVIYSSIDYWNTMSPVYTTLATFDRNGSRIASLVFACDCSEKKIKTGKISGNEIYLENFEREWLHPIDEVSFEDNAVTSCFSTGKARYRIEDDGRIVAVEVPDSFGDTLKYAKSEGGKHAF